MEKKTKAFTLIELMITMSIFFILSLSTYLSYSHFQKKALLKQGVKEVVKTIYDARNLAINGLDSGSGNVSIGLYFDMRDPEKQNEILYYSYPFSFTGAQILPEETKDIHLLKQYTLPQGVTIDSMDEKKRFLIYFSSPEGKPKYFYWDGGESSKQEVHTDQLDILVSIENATSPSLQKQIKYYTDGNIADY